MFIMNIHEEELSLKVCDWLRVGVWQLREGETQSTWRGPGLSQLTPFATPYPCSPYLGDGVATAVPLVAVVLHAHGGSWQLQELS